MLIATVEIPPVTSYKTIGGLISIRVWMALILANMIFICHYTVADDGIIKHLPRAFSFIITGKDDFRDGPMRMTGKWSVKKRR